MTTHLKHELSDNEKALKVSQNQAGHCWLAGKKGDKTHTCRLLIITQWTQ